MALVRALIRNATFQLILTGLAAVLAQTLPPIHPAESQADSSQDPGRLKGVAQTDKSPRGMVADSAGNKMGAVSTLGFEREVRVIETWNRSFEVE